MMRPLMRSILVVLCLTIPACRLDAQANTLLSRRARLTLEWRATPQEQQDIEQAFLSAEWPIVRGRGPTDRATLMVFLHRPDSLARVRAWTARVVDIESGKVLGHLWCAAQPPASFPSDLPRLLRRELSDSVATEPVRAGGASCTSR